MGIEDREKSQEIFNHSAGVAAASQGVMAMIVDVQGAVGMSPDDAEGYLAHLGGMVTALRAGGVPVTWMTMGRGSAAAPYDKTMLYEPTGDPSPRDRRQLEEEMDFDGARPGRDNAGIFENFLDRNGPRGDEAVMVKFFKSGFVTPQDYANNSDLREVLAGHVPPATPLPEPGQVPARGLRDYVTETGVREVLLLGAMSSHCISENAASAIQAGLNPVVVIDGVLSWDGEADNPRSGDRPTWRRGFDNDQDARDWHEGKIRAALADIAADPRRGLTPMQQAALSQIRFATADELGFDGSGPVSPLPTPATRALTIS